MRNKKLPSREQTIPQLQVAEPSKAEKPYLKIIFLLFCAITFIVLLVFCIQLSNSIQHSQIILTNISLSQNLYQILPINNETGSQNQQHWQAMKRNGPSQNPNYRNVSVNLTQQPYFTSVRQNIQIKENELQQKSQQPIDFAQKDAAETLKYNYYIVVHSSQPEFEKFEKLMKSIKDQTFTKWNVLYFSNETKQETERRSIFLKNQEMQKNVLIIPSFPSRGMNYYEAFNNRCPKRTIGIMIDEGEQFQNQNSLESIVKQFQNDRNMYILGSGVTINGSFYRPWDKISSFKRYHYQSQNIKNQIYRNISLHIRAFKTDHFRDLYPFDMVTVHDEFYNDKIYFLFPLLEMIAACKVCYYKYKSIDLQYPTKILIMPQSLFKSSLQFPAYSQQIEQIFFKQAYYPLNGKLQFQRFLSNGHPQTWGQDIEPGQYNLLKKNITKDSIRIPKNVHQFWINARQMPPFRRKLSEIAKQKYKGYEYRMWTKQDITKQNFPRTYDLLIKLMDQDKKSPQSRMSMVADLMRLEVLLNYGGFHIDLNYQVFKTYDQFRHYPFVVGVQLQYQAPKVVSMGMFGAEKGCKYIDELLTPKYLNRINIKGKANLETGPHFVGKVTKIQDMYYYIKYIPTQVYLPFLPWSNDNRIRQCKCRFKPPIPEYLKGTYNSTELIGGLLTITPCRSQYPSSVYGIDHFYNGGSWKRKTK